MIAKEVDCMLGPITESKKQYAFFVDRFCQKFTVGWKWLVRGFACEGQKRPRRGVLHMFEHAVLREAEGRVRFDPKGCACVLG